MCPRTGVARPTTQPTPPTTPRSHKHATFSLPPPTPRNTSHAGRISARASPPPLPPPRPAGKRRVERNKVIDDEARRFFLSLGRLYFLLLTRARARAWPLRPVDDALSPFFVLRALLRPPFVYEACWRPLFSPLGLHPLPHTMCRTVRTAFATHCSAALSEPRAPPAPPL